MKRIDVYYDGRVYSVGQQELADIQQSIVDGQARGGTWLLVNDGEGTRRDAYLWISPGASIALVPIPDESSAEGTEEKDAHGSAQSPTSAADVPSR